MQPLLMARVTWYLIIERGNTERANIRMNDYVDKRMALLEADFVLIQGDLKRWMEIRKRTHGQ